MQPSIPYPPNTVVTSTILPLPSKCGTFWQPIIVICVCVLNTQNVLSKFHDYSSALDANAVDIYYDLVEHANSVEAVGSKLTDTHYSSPTGKFTGRFTGFGIPEMHSFIEPEIAK